MYSPAELGESGAGRPTSPWQLRTLSPWQEVGTYGMPALSFRFGVPSDAAELAEFMARTFRDTYSSSRYGDCRDEDVEAYAAERFAEPVQAAELADSGLVTLLVEVDGTLAGYAQLRPGSACPTRPGPRPVEIARLYVDRRWHGQGVAWALMDACVSRDAAADPLWLCVYRHNARAIAFYPSCRMQSESPSFAARMPLLILMGEADDWTPAAPCNYLTKAAQARGEKVEFVLYPGAVHDFDHPRLDMKERENIAYSASGTGKVTVGTNPAAREDALKRVDAFLKTR